MSLSDDGTNCRSSVRVTVANPCGVARVTEVASVQLPRVMFSPNSVAGFQGQVLRAMPPASTRLPFATVAQAGMCGRTIGSVTAAHADAVRAVGVAALEARAWVCRPGKWVCDDWGALYAENSEVLSASRLLVLATMCQSERRSCATTACLLRGMGPKSSWLGRDTKR